MKHRDFMFATSSSSIGDPPLRQYVEPNLDYLEGCTIPGCCTPKPCDVGLVQLPPDMHLAVADRLARYLFRHEVTERKAGWRVPGRLRLGRMRLYQAVAGLE